VAVVMVVLVLVVVVVVVVKMSGQTRPFCTQSTQCFRF